MREMKQTETIQTLNDLPDVDWGVKAIKAPEIWKYTKGEGVKVVVIDSGIDMNHPDFKDSFKAGMNMFEKTTDVTDDYGHGTHVAGLIAGKNTGVAPNAELYISKSLDNNGFGSMASVMDGITYAMNYEVDVMCLSLGIKGGLPVILQQRIIDAYTQGITIVCATGNEGHYEPQYPAFMDQVIAVGGLNKELTPTSFSNHGKELDVVAPSIDILSTYKDGNYARMTGTSMASPLVAGSIALLVSYYKKQGIKLSPSDVKEHLNNLGTHSYQYGYGVMDLTKLINEKE